MAVYSVSLLLPCSKCFKVIPQLSGDESRLFHTCQVLHEDEVSAGESYYFCLLLPDFEDRAFPVWRGVACV